MEGAKRQSPYAGTRRRFKVRRELRTTYLMPNNFISWNIEQNLGKGKMSL